MDVANDAEAVSPVAFGVATALVSATTPGCSSISTLLFGEAGIVSREGTPGLGDAVAFRASWIDLAKSGSGGWSRPSITAGSRSERRAGLGGLPLALARFAFGEDAGTILLKV